METNASAGGACINLARRSFGNPAMMDGNGNCRPLGLAAVTADAASKTGRGLDCGAAGDEVRGGAMTDMGRAGATFVAPLSSKRRSSPRNKPTNFDFTMFDIADLAIPVFCKINKRFR